jgi:chromosome partitioning protein
VNPKGGTGKTTIAVHPAVAAYRKGHAVRLVDADMNSPPVTTT